tara:strand:+ start:820 stop:1017 length:198 start_codon:yes stop_codon:yes gene_type:complete
MQCFNCGFNTKTIYPKIRDQQYVQKMCLACGWKSYPILVISQSKLEKNARLHNLEVQASTSKPGS